MKNSLRLFVFIVFIVLTSCSSTPTIDGKSPFIVREIRTVDDSMSEYVSYVMTVGYPTIILPSRMYNIGDTISLVKLIKQIKYNETINIK